MDSKLRQYLELKSKQLKLDLEATTLFKGTMDIGTVAEDAIRRFLGAVLPSRYGVGLGEVISASSQTVNQTQPKDVVIYDPTYSPVFGWGEAGFHLFPIESVYAVIEVKKTIDTGELLKAIDQATEAKQLARQDLMVQRPFTAVVAFHSDITTETLLEKVGELAPERRVDFVLILNPKPTQGDSDASQFSPKSDYIAHWNYHTPGVGGGAIEFTTAYDAASEAKALTSKHPPGLPHVYLTWGQSEHTLMWFYLLLISKLDEMETQRPNLWQYAQANKTDLGYRRNL
jgi:hypothetical protein